MLGFSIHKTPILEIRWRQRQLIALYKHWIYEFDCTRARYEDNVSLNVEKITLGNVGECNIQNNFSPARMRHYLEESPDKCLGYLFREHDGDVAGFLWVMLRDGDEYQYKVRKCDAFLFDIWVAENKRGMGYCGQMIDIVLNNLMRHGYKTVRLGVRKNNISAIKAYEKAGGRRITSTSFFIIARRIRMPYITI